MSDEKRTAVLKAIKKLKEKGVTGIKVELEAQMDRDHDEEDSFVELMNIIADRTGTDYDGSQRNYNEATDPFPWMRYGRFYDDGSVDSELTFTITLDDEDNIFYLPTVVSAFSDLSDQVGHRFDVRGAGMHMALLFSKDCSYPHNEDNYLRRENPASHRLHRTKLLNFKRAVTSLLPALYFLASPDGTSRALEYRRPIVSIEGDGSDGGKYSAVTYRSGAIEYRVFDTCYDSPGNILDNVVIIGNTIKYLSMGRISTGVEKAGESIAFGVDTDDTVERFYQSISHIDALNIGLQRIKPSYMKIREIKRNRGFRKTKNTVRFAKERLTKQAEKAYAAYMERHEILSCLRFEADRSGMLLSLQNCSNSPLTGAEMVRAEERAREYAEERCAKDQPQAKPDFIERFIDNNTIRNGDYTLQLG